VVIDSPHASEAPLSVWLESRAPAPPPELAAAMSAMSAGLATREPTPEALLDAARGAMRTLLSGGCLTRASALDLLAVDALVTYAFEAAAEAPERLDARAQQALVSIAALAESYRP